MSEQEATQLLIRRADARSINIKPPKTKPWSLLGRIAEKHCAREEISQYVQVLRERKASGAALIRPKVVSRPRTR